MNCHGNNKDKQGFHKHSALKHILHMALCCGLPIIIIGFLPNIARYSPAASGILGRIAPFICPVMMILMLTMMFRDSKKGNCCDDRNESQDNNKTLELNESAK